VQKQVQDQGREHQQLVQRLDATLQQQQQQHAALLSLLSGVSCVLCVCVCGCVDVCGCVCVFDCECERVCMLWGCVCVLWCKGVYVYLSFCVNPHCKCTIHAYGR